MIDVWIILIGSIAIVGFWRGTWNLMDKFIFPNDIILSSVVTMVGGFLILYILSRYK